jgi:hypothetical protein
MFKKYINDIPIRAYATWALLWKYAYERGLVK